MALQFKPAIRHSVPLLMSIAGPSGSGKTFSAILMAAGIAGKDGKVGLVDTENGRGSMYADSPSIKAALPNGYQILGLYPPFSPRAYVEAIDAAENSGINVLVIDSGSHEWEGTGGCSEIAEKNEKMPDWKTAKLQHKKFVNRLLSTTMHVIVCLRARDKVKVLKRGDALLDGEGIADRTMVVPLGLQPICEKNFVFEMLVSLLLDEKTHVAMPLKCPEPLQPLFNGAKLITKSDGESIRQWNDGAPESDSSANVSKRARLAAEEGLAAYQALFASLTLEQRKRLTDSGEHAANKDAAKYADSQAGGQ